MACSSCNKKNIDTESTMDSTIEKQIIKEPVIRKSAGEIEWNNPNGYAEINWDGTLLDFEKHGILAENVIIIKKVGKNKYHAIYVW